MASGVCAAAAILRPNLILPTDGAGRCAPKRALAARLVRLEGRPVREPFFNAPDHGIIGLRHLEGKATRLQSGQPDMLREMRRDDAELLLRRANQSPRETDDFRGFECLIACLHSGASAYSVGLLLLRSGDRCAVRQTLPGLGTAKQRRADIAANDERLPVRAQMHLAVINLPVLRIEDGAAIPAGAVLTHILQHHQPHHRLVLGIAAAIMAERRLQFGIVDPNDAAVKHAVTLIDLHAAVRLVGAVVNGPPIADGRGRVGGLRRRATQAQHKGRNGRHSYRHLRQRQSLHPYPPSRATQSLRQLLFRCRRTAPITQGMEIPFMKMHGAGNDFVILDGRARALELTPARVRHLADRRLGIGCDQLISLEPDTSGADVFMRIHNPDGSEAGACGNATRCVAQLIGRELGRDRVTIRTISGDLPSMLHRDGSITVDLGAPRLGWNDVPLARAMDTLHLPLAEAGLAEPAACSMGNPHATFFVKTIGETPVAALGPRFETDALFPDRANIGFAEILSSDRIRLRVWERGAGLTLACGSGACATLVNAARRGLTGRRAEMILDGGRLTIEWRESDGHVLMTGPAETSFAGSITLPETLMEIAA
ncbi:hypothetical protein Dimus_023622 [Dionaea muscipula]